MWHKVNSFGLCYNEGSTKTQTKIPGLQFSGWLGSSVHDLSLHTSVALRELYFQLIRK